MPMRVSEDLHREVIVPSDEAAWHALRAQDLTSTDIAALFGVSPYLTPWELWQRKKGALQVAFEASERVRWGTRLQDAIAAGIGEDHGLRIRRMNEYIRLPRLRLGSSFDYEILPADAGPEGMTDLGRLGLLEIKNVDALQYRDGWVTDGKTAIEAPPHIELQVQHQLAVSGRAYALIGALVGGNTVALLRREPQADLLAAIQEKAAAFWASIDANEPPPPDFSRDADAIARVHAHAEPGKTISVDRTSRVAALVEEYRSAGAALTDAETRKKAAKAEILTLIGEAEKVVGEGWSISARVIGPIRVEAFERPGYRDFRVNVKKAKAPSIN